MFDQEKQQQKKKKKKKKKKNATSLSNIPLDNDVFSFQRIVTENS